MNYEDLLLTNEQIDAKYPGGSPEYPTHSRGCGCSGCHASWTEWRGGRAAVVAAAPVIAALTAERDAAYAKGRADERADACALLAKWEGFAAKQFEIADGTKRRILAETTQNYRDAQMAIKRGEHVKPPAPLPARD